MNNCTSANGKFSSLEYADITAAGTVRAAPGINPCSAVVTISGSGNFAWNTGHWNTGQRSDFTATFNLDPAAGSLALNGEFTNGPLEGDHPAGAPVVVYPNLDCATEGLKTLTVPTAALTFG